MRLRGRDRKLRTASSPCPRRTSQVFLEYFPWLCSTANLGFKLPARVWPYKTPKRRESTKSLRLFTRAAGGGDGGHLRRGAVGAGAGVKRSTSSAASPT